MFQFTVKKKAAEKALLIAGGDAYWDLLLVVGLLVGLVSWPPFFPEMEKTSMDT